MTNEEIAKEAKDYTESSTIDGRIPYGIDDAVVIQDTFTYGIQWYKKNLWHTIKEKPNIDEQILCIDINGEAILVWQDGDWNEKVSIYTIQKWCYIKDLIL